MRAQRKFALSIAGLDPSGGAGLFADMKTFEQLHVHGLGVCTAITLQTEETFKGVAWIPFHQIQLQLDALLTKYPVDFLKIGLIQSMNILNDIVQHIRKKYSQIKIIWDPIMSATAGFEFHKEINEKLLNEILSQIYLVTPNTEEAAMLMKETESMKAAEALGKFCSVLMKSYMDEQSNHFDVLLNGSEKYFLKSNILTGHDKHGSGCVLSAALTANLVHGHSLRSSCEKAKDYAVEFLKSSNGLLGKHNQIKTGIGNAESH